MTEWFNLTLWRIMCMNVKRIWKHKTEIVFILSWFLLFKFKYHLTDDWLFVIDIYTNHFCSYCGFASTFHAHSYLFRGGSRGGGAPGTRPPPPLKLEKIWFFYVKSWFFTRNIPKIFAPPSAWRNYFKCAPPNLKSWIRPCYCLPSLPDWSGNI
jgi:hypothetical protein